MIISYSVDIVDKPNHLNVEFFRDTLENVLLRTDFEIRNIEFTMGSSAGENYCSTIYRVKVTHNSSKGLGSTSLIIKSMPQKEGTEFLLELDVFHKEKIFYNMVLPRLEVLIEDRGKFAPRLYHSLKTPVNTLVFEDLSKLNYKLASREKGLNLPHCILVMKKLGQFHAVSKRLFEKEPELADCFQSGIISENCLRNADGTMMKLFGGGITGLIGLIEEWPGYEGITTKIRRYAKCFRNNLQRCAALSSNDFKVLNHGDLWVNNILFKYDANGAPVDINFVDFQMSVWSSPGIDLNYFFYTSLNLDVMQSHSETLLREYHKSLRSHMIQLGLENIPSYEQICEEFRQRQPYGFFAHYAIFPLISQDSQNSQDSCLEKLRDEEYAKRKAKEMFSSERLQQTYRYTLRQFDEMHIFD